MQCEVARYKSLSYCNYNNSKLKIYLLFVIRGRTICFLTLFSTLLWRHCRNDAN